MTHLITLRDCHEGGPQAFVQSLWYTRRRSFAPPQTVILDPVAIAVVNHGRWIAECPFCPGAELVDLDKRLFFCGSCLNKGVGGQWLTVSVPAERQAIEEALVKRSDEATRNWTAGESAADLRRENKNRLYNRKGVV